VKFRLVTWILLVSLLGFRPGVVIATPPPTVIPAGTALSAAIQQLRSQDLTVLFSDRLISSELKVARDLKVDDPREAILRLLADHGLTLRTLRPGLFVVVRSLKPESPAPAPVADLEPLAEVAIYASRYSSDSPLTSAAQLERTDVESLASLNEDVLRVTRSLPGTASTPLSAKTHVRGGRDDEMLVRFDGIPQLAPFHFKDYGAILGSIEPNTIDSLDFYSGVFPVRHGNRLSAVMDIHPRTPNEGNHHELGLSLLAMHGLSVGEQEIGGAPTRWLIAGRTSSARWITRAAEIDGIDIEFSDLLLRSERDIDSWTLTVGAKILQDELKYTADNDDDDDEPVSGDETDAKYNDGTYWFRAQRTDEHARVLKLSAAYFNLTTGRYGRYATDPIVAGTVRDDRRSSGYYLESIWQKSGAWSLGAEAMDLRTSYDHAIDARFDPILARTFRRSSDLQRRTLIDARTRTLSVHTSRLIHFSSNWRADIGIRADHRNQPKSSVEWSPRIAMEYELSDGRFLRASAGRVTQGQRSDELPTADGETLFYPVQKSDQWVLGYEQLLADRGVWRVEAYRKQIHDPSPRYENLLNPVSLIPEMEIDRRRIAPDGALAYGLEASARYTFNEHWSSFANYAWSEIEDDFGTTDVPRNWNQQHAFMIGARWRSGPWAFSGQGFWRTGWSRTEFEIGDAGELQPVIGERNRARWPAQWSLDIRATWRKSLNVGSIEVALDVNNLTNRSNPCCTDLRLTSDGLEARTRSWLPRYLNLGVVWNLP